MRRFSYIYLSLLFLSACPKTAVEVGSFSPDAGTEDASSQAGGAFGGTGGIAGSGSGGEVVLGGAPGSGGAANGGASTLTHGTGGATGGVTGTGGSTGGNTAVLIQDLIPRNNAVAGWVVDPWNSRTAGVVAAIATTKQGTENLIDGSAEDFWGEVTADKVPKKFAWQVYVNASLVSSAGRPNDGSVLQLYVFEMPSDTAAAGLYAWLVKDKQYALYDPQAGWTEPTAPLVGTKSRVVNDNGLWWINFFKGNYYVEVDLSPSYGPPPDYREGDLSQKAAAFNFALAVAARIPEYTPSLGTVTFKDGKAQGAMTGYGWVALGASDVLTDPTCKGVPITQANPCLAVASWNSTSALCISGKIPAIPANPTPIDYANNWGVTLGVNAADPQSAGNLGRNYATVSFDLTGSVLSAEGGAPSLISRLPASNEIGTWTLAGAPVAINTDALLYSQVDGAAPKYIERGWRGSVYAKYQQSGGGVNVAIHDMGDSMGAENLYNYDLPASRLQIASTKDAAGNPTSEAVVNMGLPNSYAALAWDSQNYIEVSITGRTDASLAYVKAFAQQILNRGKLTVRANVHRQGDPAASVYCAAVQSGISVALTSFNTSCWDGLGTTLTAADIPKIDWVDLMVASGPDALTVNNLCLTGIAFQ